MMTLPSRLAAAALSLSLSLLPTARADAVQLNMKFCTDSSCSSGCTSWMTDAGSCAAGTAGNSWVSSVTTLLDPSDSSKGSWRLFFENATSHACSADHTWPACNTTIKLDGGCHQVSLCDGLVTGSMSGGTVVPAGVVAGIVIGLLLLVCCCCACAYACCCRPGACCNPAKATPMAGGGGGGGSGAAAMPVGYSVTGAPAGSLNGGGVAMQQALYYSGGPQPMHAQPMQQMSSAGGGPTAPGFYYAQPYALQPYVQQQQQQAVYAQPAGFSVQRSSFSS